MNSAREHRILIAILAVGLFARLFFGMRQPPSDEALTALPDQVEYLQLGRNLLHNHSLSFIDPRFNQTIYAYRTPGYPLFIAALGGNVRLIRIAQSLLDVSTALASYLLARRWMSGAAALFAAAAVAFNPYLIFFSGLILSETLFVAMLAWGMLLCLRRATFLPGVLLLALSILVRPSAMLLPILLAAIGALANRRDPCPYPRWWLLPPATTAMLFTFATLTPWALRNQHVLGEMVWTTTNGGVTLYDGFNPAATGASDQRFLDSMRYLRASDEIDRDRLLGQQARLWIDEHPREAFNLAGPKIARTWSPMPLSEQYSSRDYILAGLLFSLPIDILAVLGLLKGRLPRAAKIYLLIPPIYFTLTHAASIGSLRYRMPAEVSMALLAASALAWVFDARHPQRRPVGEQPMASNT